jgi:hypothetical protein
MATVIEKRIRETEVWKSSELAVHQKMVFFFLATLVTKNRCGEGC